MSRPILIRILLGLLLLGAVALLATVTEWVDVEVDKPPRGEAAKNDLYAVQALLRTLGATVVKRQDLEAMPPANSHLVLVSRHWDLFPDRGQRLRDWVEQGGHLVIPGAMVDHPRLREWIAVAGVKKPSAPSAAPARGGTDKDRDCRELAEPESVAASYADGGRTLRVCVPLLHMRYEPAANQVPLWSLDSPVGTEIIRVAVSEGTVTVFGPGRLLENEYALRADNAQAVAAMLRARPGALFWFVAEESRDPFLAWLWHQGWPALVPALLALALFLWRGAVRFGPLAARTDNNRRSMTEQVAGTAHFLQRHGPAALHAAQARALHETAGRQLRHYTRLDASERAQAIAAATHVSAQALTRALQPSSRSPIELPADLEIMETARRRLEPLSPSS